MKIGDKCWVLVGALKRASETCLYKEATFIGKSKERVTVRTALGDDEVPMASVVDSFAKAQDLTSLLSRTQNAIAIAAEEKNKTPEGALHRAIGNYTRHVTIDAAELAYICRMIDLLQGLRVSTEQLIAFVTLVRVFSPEVFEKTLQMMVKDTDVLRADTGK